MWFDWKNLIFQCFAKVLDGDNACLAYTITLKTAMRSLSDKDGRPLFVTSGDSSFPTTLQFGVSRHYVQLLSILNRLISALRATGVVNSWVSNESLLANVIGRHRAREEAKDGGGQSREEEIRTDDSICTLLVQILAVGMTFASVTFLCEVLPNVVCGTWLMPFREIGAAKK